VVSCGGLVRNIEDEWLACFSKHLRDSSAFVAELWESSCRTTTLQAKGYMSIELQTHFVAVYQILKEDKVGSSGGRSIIQVIRSLLQVYWNIAITHVYGKANKYVD
jgi:hypothetical protein